MLCSRRYRNDEADKKGETRASHHLLRLRLRSRDESRRGQFRTLAQTMVLARAALIGRCHPEEAPRVMLAALVPVVDDDGVLTRSDVRHTKAHSGPGLVDPHKDNRPRTTPVPIATRDEET